jgi:hypothetical protein
MPRRAGLLRLALAASILTLVAVPPARAQDAAKLPSGREVIDRYVEAIGGKAAVTKYKSTKVEGTFAVPSQGLTGTMEVLTAAPDRFLLRVTLPGVGEIANGFDGAVGWLVDPMMGPMLLHGEALAEMKVDADYYAALHDDRNVASVETVERTVFEGAPVYKVRVERRSGGEDFEFYDVASGLLVGSTGKRTLPMGTFDVTNVLSDYKDFGGLRLATRSRQQMMGIEQVMTISSVEFDTVDAAAFALPPQIKALVK